MPSSPDSSTGPLPKVKNQDFPLEKGHIHYSYIQTASEGYRKVDVSWRKEIRGLLFTI